FSCWRASAVSEADAHQAALEAARRVARTLAEGRSPQAYTYGSTTLREELIEEVHDADGNTIAVVTRNGYGALVLNAARVMFLDFDFEPASPWEGIGGFFRRLLGTKGPDGEAQREQRTREAFERFLEERPAWSVRLYRTSAGLRAMVVHDVFDPAAESTEQCMQQAGCDPMYRKLCRLQASFRARLTPKPWRCGVSQPSVKYPFESDGERGAFERWQAKYLDAQRGFATCRLVATLGNGHAQPEAAALVPLHDRLTRCDSGLPLA
ncbi:MAG: hypothetical protein ACOY3P_06390, partial [Planctomycetota bacterium]